MQDGWQTGLLSFLLTGLVVLGLLCPLLGVVAAVGWLLGYSVTFIGQFAVFFIVYCVFISVVLVVCSFIEALR